MLTWSGVQWGEGEAKQMRGWREFQGGSERHKDWDKASRFLGVKVDCKYRKGRGGGYGFGVRGGC